MKNKQNIQSPGMQKKIKKYLKIAATSIKRNMMKIENDLENVTDLIPQVDLVEVLGELLHQVRKGDIKEKPKIIISLVKE